ncbi:hypothetical protein [Longimicrobium sp.]|uniref:hypothetical protein n=1 Tax=Longimicrobium sp. TaxID=2029185 RepID=UPI002D0A8DDA|nr:hypothetical protein [Longimicrobium sp.]HSU12729.1 hypothetical protein [Longimicrobium sp.]
MRRQRTRTLLLPLLAALALPAAANAQESTMRGTWTINRAASDDVNRAIETAVSRMSFITRPIARGRLRRTNPVYSRVVVNYTPQQVSTVFDARHAIESPANGQPVKWTREDGEKFDLSTEWQQGRLVQTFRAEDGSRTNTYVVSPDGHTLTMHVVLRSPKLPQPLEYKMVFNKAS